MQQQTGPALDQPMASAALYAEAQRWLPGGTCASGRVNPYLGHPFYVARGEGARVWDVEGRVYIDMCTSNGATLLGHGHPAVRAAIEQALAMGLVCAYETPYHADLARQMTEVIPCAEQVRLTGSGTETTWHAVRVARVATGRERVIKFEGHFHGYNDYLQYSFWPPVERAGPPEAPVPFNEGGGVPRDVERTIEVLPFNDLAAAERAIRDHGEQVACVILEPINFDAGGIEPLPGFLEGLRRLTSEYGIILIFDEILSGFRTGPGGAQSHYGVTPDLCTLGKALGGGTALSAFAGSRAVMGHVSPLGAAVHTGTYNGHLIPVLAARAFLAEIERPDFYPHLEALAARLYPGLDGIFQRLGLPARVQGVGCRFGLFFGEASQGPVTNWREAARHDKSLARRFFAACHARGVYWHDAWHHGFSGAHTLADIDEVLSVAEDAARAMAAGQA
jgi:glutamate-1-semialdehyde 2,1-aminomutase